MLFTSPSPGSVRPGWLRGSVDAGRDRPHARLRSSRPLPKHGRPARQPAGSPPPPRAGFAVDVPRGSLPAAISHAAEAAACRRRDHQQVPATHSVGKQQQLVRVLLGQEPADLHHTPGHGHFARNDGPVNRIHGDPGDPSPQRIEQGQQRGEFRREIRGAEPPGTVQQCGCGTCGSQRQTRRRGGEPVFGCRRKGNGRSHGANPAPGRLPPARVIYRRKRHERESRCTECPR